MALLSKTGILKLTYFEKFISNFMFKISAFLQDAYIEFKEKHDFSLNK